MATITSKYSKESLVGPIKDKVAPAYIDAYFKVYSDEYPEFKIDDIQMPKNLIEGFRKDLLQQQAAIDKVINLGFSCFEYFAVNKDGKPNYSRNIQSHLGFKKIDKFFGITSNGVPQYKNLEEFDDTKDDAYDIIDKILNHYNDKIFQRELLKIFKKVWSYQTTFTLEDLWRKYDLKIYTNEVAKLIYNYQEKTAKMHVVKLGNTSMVQKKKYYELSRQEKNDVLSYLTKYFKQASQEEKIRFGLYDFTEFSSELIFKYPKSHQNHSTIFDTTALKHWEGGFSLDGSDTADRKGVDYIYSALGSSNNILITIESKISRLNHSISSQLSDCTYLDSYEDTPISSNYIFNGLWYESYDTSGHLVFPVIDIPNSIFLDSNFDEYNSFKKFIIIHKRIALKNEDGISNQALFKNFCKTLKTEIDTYQEKLYKMYYKVNTIPDPEMWIIQRDLCKQYLEELSQFVLDFDLRKEDNISHFIVYNQISEDIKTPLLKLREIISKKYDDKKLSKYSRFEQRTGGGRIDKKEIEESLQDIVRYATVTIGEFKSLYAQLSKRAHNLDNNQSPFDRENEDWMFHKEQNIDLKNEANELEDLITNKKQKLKELDNSSDLPTHSLHRYIRSSEFSDLKNFFEKFKIEDLDDLRYTLANKFNNKTLDQYTIDGSEVVDNNKNDSIYMWLSSFIQKSHNYLTNADNKQKQILDKYVNKEKGSKTKLTITQIFNDTLSDLIGFKEYRVSDFMNSVKKTAKGITYRYIDNKSNAISVNLLDNLNFESQISILEQNDFQDMVLRNLFINSIKHNRDKVLDKSLSIIVSIGVLTKEDLEELVSVGRFSDSGFLEDISSNQKYYAITYEDNGIGINSDTYHNNKDRIKSECCGLFDIQECVRWHQGSSIVNSLNEKKDGYSAFIIIPQ